MPLTYNVGWRRCKPPQHVPSSLERPPQEHVLKGPASGALPLISAMVLHNGISWRHPE